MTQFLDYLSEKYPQDSVDEINRRLLELSSLFEISQLINESLELSRVLNNVMLIPMGRMMIPRCAIVLKRQNQFEVVMTKGLPEELKQTVFSVNEIPQQCFTAQYFKKLKKECPRRLQEFVKQGRLEIAVPFTNNNQLLGFMMFGAKLSGKEFSEAELNFLNSLANLSATTIDNALQLKEIKQINRRLDEKVHELKTLFDIGQGLSATLDSQKILRLLVYALMGQMFITKYAVLLKCDSKLELKDRKGFSADFLDHIAGAIANLEIPEGAMSVQDISDNKLCEILLKNDVQTLIPMAHQEKLLGYLLLGSKLSGQPYTKTDFEFLTTLVSQAVISLENARLFEETLEKQRLEEELNVARTIQKKLLPKKLPEISGYDIYGMNNSSQQVGGDYFDVIQIDENHIALAIGDVSGKGVPASLLMANLQAALRVMMTPDMNLAEVVAKLNNLIHSNTGLDKFITFFIGILDTVTHTLTYVNAGHNNPVHLSIDREIKFLDVGGIILGILPKYSYQTGQISLEPGDLVFTYTDGVNEAIDANGEEWGEEPLYELIKSTSPKMPVREIVEKILHAIKTFAGNEPQADDVTMLAFRRLK